jgi:amino acid adenylation domain-containing protein
MSHQVLKADQWPIFEICASLLNNGRTRLHISMDALVCDAWSLFILSREFVQLYDDPEAAFPPLSLRFRDYVIGERALRETEVYERSLSYWKERLETLPGAPELPLVKNPGELQWPQFVRRRGVLREEIWRRLKERAGRAGVTPSGVLLAAYAEVLGQWSKTAEFTLNLTLFNRLPLHEEVGSVVGDFTSLTLLEVRQGAEETFELRARRLQEQLWSDLDHRYVSGVRVMRELGRARPGARTSFPVVFTSALIYDEPAEQPSSELAEAEIIYGITQTPQVWIDQQVTERGGELWYNWDSLEELFPAGLIEDMMGAYGALLERLASREGAWNEARAELLPSWQLEERAAANDTEWMKSEELLHTLFAQRVLEGAKRAAVISARRSLNYGELLYEAEALSEELLAAGVQVGELVAVVMEKGWEQVVAVLAVERAGGAYLPLEASLPEERIEYLLRDGGVQVVLTQSWVAARLGWPAEVKQVVVVQERAEAGAEAGLELAQQWLEERRQGSRELAYVIYTSGSTGTPKGVMITHAGAVNTILDVNERYGIGPADRVLAVSSLSFDLSVYDVFGLLAAGGALVLPGAGERKEAAAWADLIRAQGVTLWNSVPALMQMLVESWPSGAAPGSGLRLALLSGDWVPVRLPGEIRERWPEAQVVSMGGATEASIWSILYEVEEVSPDWRSIPYGKPMRNQQFRIVNSSRAAAPVWVAGQLEIGGVGVALGYWGDPERTQERFVVAADGGRWYRTGDLGRYLPGGEIEFLGREDGQVKIGGHRVEVGEISAVLSRHPALSAAVVRAVGERETGRRLIAYVVPEMSDRLVDLDSEQLSTFLKKKLPEYMIPSAFVLLDQLPLTANGKIDLNALPVPDTAGTWQTTGFVAPRTPLEELIAERWSDILELPEVGVMDDFFEMGGDSVTGTQVVSDIRETLKIEFPLRQLFEAPTVAGTAEYVQSMRRAQIESPTPSIRPAAITDHLPLSFAQERVWFLNQLSPDDLSYNIPGALRLTGNLDLDALTKAINETIKRHDSLRATFEVIDGNPVQVIAGPAPIDLPLVDFTHLPPEQREAAARDFCVTESLQLFDLARGPLIRTTLLKIDAEEHILFFNLHHIVADAWSLQVLAREVGALYAAFAEDKPSPLTDLPLRYVDFAVWQRQWLQGETLERELSYWKAQLADAEVLEFPTDYTRSISKGSRGKSLIRTLPVELAQGLRLTSRRERATLYMTMLAAFKVLLHFYTRQVDVVIGSSIANRNRAEIEGLIGFFVNILVLRTSLAGNPTFSELLRRVREVTLEAYLHQDLPFEKLVKELNPERNPTSHAPLFRVLFVHELPMRQLEAPGLTITNVELQAEVSRYDLNLHIIGNANEIKAVLQYNSDLFAPATATKLLDQYEAILTRIVANPSVTLDELLATLEENETHYQARRREARKRKDIKELRQVARN